MKMRSETRPMIYQKAAPLYQACMLLEEVEVAGQDAFELVMYGVRVPSLAESYNALYPIRMTITTKGCISELGPIRPD
jgi:hypothetical protein